MIWDAISAPRNVSWPRKASGPLNGNRAPIFHSFGACALTARLPAGIAAAIAAATIKTTFNLRICWSPLMDSMFVAKVGAFECRISQEFGTSTRHRDAAVLHHVRPVGDRKRMFDVLLDEQDRQALGAQLSEQRKDVAYDHRR